MKNAILGIFEWIVELLDFSGAGSSMLSGSIGSLIPGFYSIASSLSTSAIMPIAYTVLSLFMLLELYKTSVRIEGAGGGFQTGAEMIFRVLIKVALCKIVLDNTPQLLNAIHNTFNGLIGSVAGSAEGGSINLADLEAQLDELDGFVAGIPYLLLALICALIAAAAYIITQIIITARVVEIYLYVAVGPLPMATLANEEMSSIGKNFLKSFAAIGLQGVLIWLVLRFIPQIFTAVSFSGSSLLMTLIGVAAQCVVIVVALTSTGRLAKSILQAS